MVATDKKNNKKKILTVIISFLIIFSLVSGIFAIREYLSLKEEKDQFQNLIETAEYNNPIEDNIEKNLSENTNILPQYKVLSERNPEMYGWIKILDTVIDYPVMYSSDDPEKYLNKDFYGKDSISGSIFLDYRCYDGCTNEILYGHNMKNDTMFGSILNYEDIEYYEAHPNIEFDTLYETRKYRIIAVFYDKIYKRQDTDFKYYNVIEIESPEEYKEIIRKYKEKSIYDTGTNAEYGDQLLTLSTCAYHVENGRFVVVAKREK